jgi:hypothetical protein
MLTGMGRSRKATRMIVATAAAACLAGCAPRSDEAASEARVRDMEERFTPGLHTLMVELAMRHASLWFAGDAENWELADYMMHELEEVAERIVELHPDYEDIPVGSLFAQMATPAIEDAERAIEATDRDAFVAAFDRLTTSCNACHAASNRTAIVIQRPTTPPLTNLRYAP